MTLLEPIADVSTLDVPDAYGFPHDEWRPQQRETCEWIMALEGVGIAELPTGSGKTLLAAMTSTQKPVVALTRTKSLQGQYADIYGFDLLTGKGNHACVHPEAGGGTRADDCLLPDRMSACPVAGRCAYLAQKARFKASMRGCTNYALWLANVAIRQDPPDALFCDEAHQLPDIVTEWTGCTVSERARVEWDLPAFPNVTGTLGGALLGNGENPIADAVGWLERGVAVLRRTQQRLRPLVSQKDLARKCDSLLGKLEATLDAIRSAPRDWFVRSGPRAGRDEPAFVAKPLTARHHFGRYFLGGPAAILMSATIGDDKTFAAELGVKDYAFHRVPNAWAPETRPVRVLDVPSMGRAATANDWTAHDRQAAAIAVAIRACPTDWSGVIHVVRKEEATHLARRLARHGLADRVWVPRTDDGTDRQMAAWAEHKRRTTGALAVTWAWHEGVNLTEERICIAAKVPWPFRGDAFELARAEYDGRMYHQRAAWGLEQMLGRTRRGNPEDYDLDGRQEQLVAIADGSWKRLRKYFSESFRESVIED